MGRVVDYICNSGLADSVGNLLVAEFNRNMAEVRQNTGIGHNYSRSDAADTIRILNTEMMATCLYSCRQKDSIPGETTIPALFQNSFKCVDLATYRNGQSVLSECKVAMKRTGFGPFFDENTFVSDIAEKFDEVESRMTSDGDVVHGKRLVVVSAAAFDRVTQLIDGLVLMRLPPGSFSTDGARHEYVLCSPAALESVINGYPVPFPLRDVYQFTL